MNKNIAKNVEYWKGLDMGERGLKKLDVRSISVWQKAAKDDAGKGLGPDCKLPHMSSAEVRILFQITEGSCSSVRFLGKIVMQLNFIL